MTTSKAKAKEDSSNAEKPPEAPAVVETEHVETGTAAPAEEEEVVTVADEPPVDLTLDDAGTANTDTAGADDDQVGAALFSVQLATFQGSLEDGRWTKAPRWLRDAYETLLSYSQHAAQDADELARIVVLFPEYVAAVQPGTAPSLIVEAMFDEQQVNMLAVDQIDMILGGGQVDREDVDSRLVFQVAALYDAHSRLLQMLGEAGEAALAGNGGIPSEAQAVARRIAGQLDPAPARAARTPDAPPEVPPIEIQACPVHFGSSCPICGGSGRVQVV